MLKSLYKILVVEDEKIMQNVLTDRLSESKNKKSLQAGKIIKGARMFERPDLDMVELYDPDVDALGYVSPREMTEKARVKQ